MTNAVDNNFLVMLLHPSVKPPIDPSTNEGLTFLPQRIEALVNLWQRRGDRIIVPTPALAEFLVFAGPDGNDYLSELRNMFNVQIRPFDLRSAVELASIEIDSRTAGSKKGPTASDPWQKVKIDRQIVAISKVNGAETIFSDDKGVCAHAQAAGLKAVSSWELSIPPQAQSLFPSS